MWARAQPLCRPTCHAGVMRDRDAARAPWASLSLALALAATLALAAALALAAVSAVIQSAWAAPRPPAADLARILIDSDAAATQAHDRTLERSAVFLRDQWGPVALPDEPVKRWVAATTWGSIMAQCLGDAGFPGAVSADGGERLDYSGVRVSGARELFEIDVASYRCQSLYPVRAWFADEIRDIEAPWALEYTRETVIPCLLAAGHQVYPVPESSYFAASWRTDDAYDPYALIGKRGSDRARAQADCPAAELILEAAS